MNEDNFILDQLAYLKSDANRICSTDDPDELAEAVAWVKWRADMMHVYRTNQICDCMKEPKDSNLNFLEGRLKLRELLFKIYLTDDYGYFMHLKKQAKNTLARLFRLKLGELLGMKSEVEK